MSDAWHGLRLLESVELFVDALDDMLTLVILAVVALTLQVVAIARRTRPLYYIAAGVLMIAFGIVFAERNLFAGFVIGGVGVINWIEAKWGTKGA